MQSSYRYSANKSRPNSSVAHLALHLLAPLTVTMAGAAVPVPVVDFAVVLVVLPVPVLVLVVIELPDVLVANSLTVEPELPVAVVAPLTVTVPFPLELDGEFGLPIMPASPM